MLVLVSAAFAGRSGAETTEEAVTGPGVSFIAYSPKPFYKDMDEMTVRFTTTGHIPRRGLLPGSTYTIWVETGKDKRDTDCYREFGFNTRTSGWPGKTYIRVLRLTTQVPNGSGGRRKLQVCFGRGRIVIEACDPARVMRTLPIQILPPRP